MTKVEIHEITKEMLEKIEVKEKETGITIAYKDTDDEFYEDTEYICWNGVCVRK